MQIFIMNFNGQQYRVRYWYEDGTAEVARRTRNSNWTTLEPHTRVWNRAVDIASDRMDFAAHNDVIGE